MCCAVDRSNVGLGDEEPRIGAGARAWIAAARDDHDVIVWIRIGVAPDAVELVAGNIDEAVHTIGLRLEIARLEFRGIVRGPLGVEAVLQIEHVERGYGRRIGRMFSLATAALRLRSRLMALPGCASANTMPSAGGSPARSS